MLNGNSHLLGGNSGLLTGNSGSLLTGTSAGLLAGSNTDLHATGTGSGMGDQYLDHILDVDPHFGSGPAGSTTPEAPHAPSLTESPASQFAAPLPAVGTSGGVMGASTPTSATMGLSWPVEGPPLAPSDLPPGAQAFPDDQFPALGGGGLR